VCPNEWLIIREFVASFVDCHSYMSLRAERSECEAIPKGDGVSSCNGGLPRRILFASGTRRSPPAGGGAPTEREWAVGSFLQCIDLRLSKIPEGERRGQAIQVVDHGPLFLVYGIQLEFFHDNALLRLLIFPIVFPYIRSNSFSFVIVIEVK
jgi:hypothetical protein